MTSARSISTIIMSAALAGMAPSPAVAHEPSQLGADLPRAHASSQSAAFATWDPDAAPVAVTYDPVLVPVGARIVGASFSARNTLVTIAVTGLQSGRHYGAHVHVNACGATGLAAGPHYQHIVDPVTPSVDPRYANPDNEVWLDFHTDAYGTAVSTAQVQWVFRPQGANSITIHDHLTSTAPGESGTAGARLACLTLPM